MFKTRIKASSINNLTDARYFAAKYAEWLGFCLEPGNPNTVSPATINAIREWVDGPAIIGEMGLSDAETLLSNIELLQLDGIQVPHLMPLETLADVSIPVIKEVFFESPDPDAVADFCSLFATKVTYFLLDFNKMGYSWDNMQTHIAEWKKVFQDYKIILEMDFTPENTPQIIEVLQPWGINLKGGEEEKVGFKSYEELDDILETIED